MFEAQRRYKEFFALRAVLVKRFPGLYVPPIPLRRLWYLYYILRYLGKLRNTFHRGKMLPIKHVHKIISKMSLLIWIIRNQIFFRPSQDVVTQLNVLPKLTYEEQLDRISKYFSYVGTVS